ncbi:ISXO2-like transposase domain protein, partial [Haemophilus influenzae]
MKAKLKPMKAISVVLEKANVGAVLQGKSRYSGFSNEMARFIPSLSLMRNQRHYCQLSERKLSLIALCIRIPFVVMMCLMSVNLA